MWGDLISVPWSRERIRNERDALTFIAENTTVPVPKVLHFSNEDGVTSLTTKVLDGKPMEDVGETLNKEDKKTLESNVFLYIHDTVLPQLNTLTSDTIGTVRGTFIPTVRMMERAATSNSAGARTLSYWPSRNSPAPTKDYVYCHNDLRQANIFVSPETLQVTGIIGWDYSGFYPQGFEFPFWLTPHWRYDNPEKWSMDDPKVDRLLEMIDKPGKTAHAPQA